MREEVLVYDTTLRDGEQMPGVVFSKEQKIEVISKSEREVAEYLAGCNLQSQIIAATMMKKDHINIARDCNLNGIILFTSLSDIHLNKKLNTTRKENLENSVKYVNYAKEKGLNVSFAGEDSSRADLGYLIKFINSLEDKIDSFFPCDTLGILTPMQTYDFIKKLKSETDCKIGLHCHNDFGQATANTLAGIEAGADIFSGTFTGIGERAGNAAIEEVVMALKYQYQKELPLNYQVLGEICNLVEKYSKAKLQDHKAISGKNAFAHESGIHVDGILKHPANYENFDPEEIGRKREILFGKHSGTSSLKYLFGEKFDNEEYLSMLQQIKSKSQLEKKSFSEQEVRYLFNK
jgi:isopropylmalate/homocitrate/citramalate synthase